MTEPKCPECQVTGIEHIVSKDSEEATETKDPWFNVAYCDKCGYIYGVFAKVVHRATSSVW
ncbi:transcriptional regulator [Peribacillus sp. SCS-155]|uniref:transcriptional regulator n=1 Tax=Peribacillus sedimenti TaxID=3115297 RepID=UPI0039061BB1